MPNFVFCDILYVNAYYLCFVKVFRVISFKKELFYSMYTQHCALSLSDQN